MKTKRRTVLLTGASAGIGLATARMLAQNGFLVWGTSRDLQRLPTISNFHPIVMEMQNADSIRAGYQQALSQAGTFDVIINNSGAGIFGAIETFPDAIRREQFELLVHGPIELINLALSDFRRQRSGLIVNVSSLASRFPIPYLGVYSAAKAALASFSQTLRMELAHTPIRVVDLQPSDIKTNFHPATKSLPGSIDERERERSDIVWNVIDKNMSAAPPPELVAKSILRILRQNNPPPVVTVGGVFQSKLAPLFTRLVPLRISEWSLRHYYKLRR